VDATIKTLETIAQQMKKESPKDGPSSTIDIASAMTSVTEGSELYLKLRGINLENKEGFFGCSDPFFQVSALKDVGGVVSHTIYTSEHLVNSLNPDWEEASIPLISLLNWNLNKAFRVSIFDWAEEQNHKAVSAFCVNLILW
jgi:hypothetical protein